MIISKITPGLHYEKDLSVNFEGYYYYKNLRVKKGDLQVNLDLPLAVVGDVLVAGDIIAPNGIGGFRRFETKGSVKSNGLVSVAMGHIKVDGDLECDGLVSDGDVFVGKDLKATYIECDGSVQAKGNINVSKYIACKDQIRAGLALDNPDDAKIFCEEVRHGEIVCGTLNLTGSKKADTAANDADVPSQV